MRLRIEETYTDPARYALIDGQLFWKRSLGRPRNDIVLPAGWYLTTSSVPAVVTEADDGRVRLSFVNPRPDSLDVFIKARKRLDAQRFEARNREEDPAGQYSRSDLARRLLRRSRRPGRSGEPRPARPGIHPAGRRARRCGGRALHAWRRDPDHAATPPSPEGPRAACAVCVRAPFGSNCRDSPTFRQSQTKEHLSDGNDSPPAGPCLTAV